MDREKTQRGKDRRGKDLAGKIGGEDTQPPFNTFISYILFYIQSSCFHNSINYGLSIIWASEGAQRLSVRSFNIPKTAAKLKSFSVSEDNFLRVIEGSGRGFLGSFFFLSFYKYAHSVKFSSSACCLVEHKLIIRHNNTSVPLGLSDTCKKSF